MNKKVQYETVIKNLELILDSERPLSVNAKMSIIASALHTTFSHWTFCGFYVICKPLVLIKGMYSHVFIFLSGKVFAEKLLLQVNQKSWKTFYCIQITFLVIPKHDLKLLFLYFRIKK